MWTGVNKDAGTVLLSAGDIALARQVAQEAARAGRDVLLLHAPTDEAAALETARRVEAEGRRCELVSGEPEDEEACQEAALHAAFLGRGSIGALVCAGGWGASGHGFDAVVRAALPLLAPGARVVHLQPELPKDAGLEARAARSALLRQARGMLGRLRRDHGLRADCLTAAAAGWAWATGEARPPSEGSGWAGALG